MYKILVSLLLFTNFSYASKNLSHWGYEGNISANYWGDLHEDYSLCKDGGLQSPINIQYSDAIKSNLPKTQIKYEHQILNIVNDGTTVKINYTGGEINIAGKTYYPLQFHFHAPSENIVNDVRHPVDMHIVHKTKDGQFGVVGVMIKEGQHNKIMEKLWNNLPKEVGEKKIYDDILINISQFLPKSKKYYMFKGSLTTPPCSENITWHVFKEPIEMSKKQIKQFTDIYHLNSRPVQEVNNRMILSVH